MDYQRLRNLTTRKLHTEMGHIYEDLETLTGQEGLMTHMLPRMCDAITPWLREQVTDPRFWDGLYDPSHVGDYPLRAITPEECADVLKRYAAMPNPFAGKEVVSLVVP